MKELLVGSKVAVITTLPRVDGRYEQVTVALANTALLMHPGMNLPFALKVTFPATEGVALSSFACRKIRAPGSRVSEALWTNRITVTLIL
jgi:hypothetical protein